ncbi:putative ATP-dependent RNA [Tetrabaena socialis]|uniref:Putative ATP-dependent RNA n=1 Tax=Tetrabaena socialis TaxID=47790 RepID=A0A2J8AJ85_9CHLO|nr:putative ATP-dependent RNA [Tetrabaena socialis]|eukprot:PNH12575.1 putative ATP-dependent RNA [Tetrabaena socialis]
MTPLNMMIINNVKPKSFQLFEETANYLYIPKFYGLQKFGAPSHVQIPTGQESKNLTFTGAMRDEQVAPCAAFYKAAKDPLRMGGIISLSCGQGKTVIALNIIGHLKMRTLIVVHKDFLLTQWHERIKQFLPNARIGLVKGKVIDTDDKDIVMASVQSLSMKDYDADVFSGIGFIVIDECHRVGTEVFSKALRKHNFQYSLGLSATVERKDGMTKAFVNFLGDVVYKGKRREDIVHVIQYSYYNEDPLYSKEELIRSIGKPNMSRMINNICAFAPRNLVVVDAITRLFAMEPQRKVLVLSDRKEQLAFLKTALLARDVIAGFYYGGLKAAQLAESETKNVLLATFAYAAEGMDCRGLDTLILASPKSDIEQSCGRILREKADERVHVPLILDVVDAFSLFERQGSKRKQYYKKNGYKIIEDSYRDSSGEQKQACINVRELLSNASDVDTCGMKDNSCTYAFRN